jgi:transcriptional regulator with XRE-family HTH domain
MPTTTPKAESKLAHARRGRRVTSPATELGKFMQQRLDSLRITRVEFARRLRVSPSTIGRLLNGETRIVQRVSAQGICEVLALDETDRRTFLQLIGQASTATFALATGTAIPKTPKYKIDLELAEDHANALSRLLNQGEARYVRESSQRWYSKLLQEQPAAKDTRLGAVQIRFGLLLGAAQEFTLPWYQRDQVAIQTYNSIEDNVICRFDMNTFRQEYAIVLSHRAPLYRALGRFDESAIEFDDALYWVQTVDDPRLRANLFRSRIHARAVQGDEIGWVKELEEACRDAQRMSSAYTEENLGMLNYAEGEGYKRFAFNPHKELSMSLRAKYAQHALQSFAYSRKDTQQQPMAQHLLMQVSEAQCLIWIEPEEAICRIEQIREIVERFFPALLNKINSTLRFARQRLQACKSDFPLLFDLDARYRQ